MNNYSSNDAYNVLLILNIKFCNKIAHPIKGVLHFGGGEGNRTPVRKPILTVFYECSRLFTFPSYAENRRSA